MAHSRLDSDERRQAIVDAAVPLFARKGFAGTTTRELAEAAGISEALLFRHFPSKQLLYREILQQLGCQGDPALEQLASLPASTAALVGMVRFMVRRCVPGSIVDTGWPACAGHDGHVSEAQSAETPLALMGAAHFSISLLTNAPR